MKMEKTVYDKIMIMLEGWTKQGIFMKNIEFCYKEAYKLYQTDLEFRATANRKTLELQQAKNEEDMCS